MSKSRNKQSKLTVSCKSSKAVIPSYSELHCQCGTVYCNPSEVDDWIRVVKFFATQYSDQQLQNRYQNLNCELVTALAILRGDYSRSNVEAVLDKLVDAILAGTSYYVAVNNLTDNYTEIFRALQHKFDLTIDRIRTSDIRLFGKLREASYFLNILLTWGLFKFRRFDWSLEVLSNINKFREDNC